MHKQVFKNVRQQTGRLFTASFLFLLFTLVGCSDNQSSSSNPQLQIAGNTMGTTYHITVVNPPNDLQAVTLKAEVDGMLEAVNQQMSTYIPDSELMMFNSASVGEEFPASEALLSLITLSNEISDKTNGRFDITVGPLVELWGFGTKFHESKPSQEAVELAKAQVGWQHILINKEVMTLTKGQQLRADLSAIAKGYGVDQVANWLLEKGITNFLVEIGGEMRTSGTNSRDDVWRIGIETPSLTHQDAQQIVAIQNKGIATSGDYRNYFEEDGQRYSHTIDPTTGYPVKHNIASVTVVSETAAEADAWATALNVSGEAKAKALAEKYKLAVFIIFYENDNETADYRFYHTKEFEPYLLQ